MYHMIIRLKFSYQKKLIFFCGLFLVCLLKGYLSTEYATYGHLIQKLDVYSFGVSLEIESVRNIMDYNCPPNEIKTLQLGKFPYMPLLFVLPLMITSSQCALNEFIYMYGYTCYLV